MKKREELISVIVPIYKVEEYLDRCIESIVNQTYKNLEIILVDDGSPDSCPEICDKWKKKDKRIIVIHKENGGLSDARNTGISFATGKYISFIDSDDWIDDNWIEELYNSIINYECDIAISSTRLFKEDGTTILERGKKRKIYTNIEAVKDLIIENNIFTTACDKLYKKELIEKNFFEKGKINEDEFWTWKTLLNAKKIICCGEPNYNYFQNNVSIMGRVYSINRLDGLDARLERYKSLKKYKYLGDLCNKNLIFDCMYHMQKVCISLNNQEKMTAINHIKDVINNIDFKKVQLETLKEFIWINLFRMFPVITAKIRNKLGVGL